MNHQHIHTNTTSFHQDHIQRDTLQEDDFIRVVEHFMRQSLLGQSEKFPRWFSW